MPKYADVEPGAVGLITSLGGIEGGKGKGRGIEVATVLCPTGVVTQVLPMNPARCWATVAHTGANPVNVQIQLGSQLIVQNLPLLPFGVFQIDTDLAWVGAVAIWNAAGSDINVLVVDCSVMT